MNILNNPLLKNAALNMVKKMLEKMPGQSAMIFLNDSGEVDILPLTEKQTEILKPKKQNNEQRNP